MIMTSQQDTPIAFSVNNDYEILTPDGWRDFSGIAKYDKKDTIKITTSSGKNIKVSDKHAFCIGNDTTYAINSLNTLIDTKDGPEDVSAIERIDQDFMYDVSGVEGCHTFYGNDIVNHNTHLIAEFWKSVFPIITSSKKSKVFVCSTANGTGNLFYKLYSGAEKGENGWTHDKIKWDEVPGRTKEWADTTKLALGSVEDWYSEFECVCRNTLITINNDNAEQQLTIQELYSMIS